MSKPKLDYSKYPEVAFIVTFIQGPVAYLKGKVTGVQLGVYLGTVVLGFILFEAYKAFKKKFQ